MKKIFLLLMLLNSVYTVQAVDSFFGFSFGLSFSFGTHANRIGLHTAAYYNYAFAQANVSFNGYYNMQSYALKKTGFEFQTGSGIQLGFGKKDSARSPFISVTENNLLQDYSLGYTYLLYLDQQKTKQAGGILSVNVHDFKFATENDLFGWGDGWRDRYRTGAFLLEYRYQNFKFAINSTLWTDDYSVSKKILNSEFPARFGYKDDRHVNFGNHSMGMLSAQVEYVIPTDIVPFGQTVKANIGIDTEKVRNVLQNRLVHDHYFIPKKWISRNPCHIPMQADDGCQYIYGDGQKIRKPKLYFNLGANEGIFY